MAKLVSVIVPVYNVVQYLDQCIGSLVKQTYKNIEIIIVDDGSTDGSGQLCDAWESADSRIKVIHQNNAGLSAARNIGLSIAAGEYVYFLDSDDYISEDAIEILESIMELSKSDICFFDARVVYENGLKDDYPMRYIRKYPYPVWMSGSGAMELFLKRGEYSSNAQLLFIRKDFLVRTKLNFKKGILHEDQLFTYEILDYAESVIHVPFQLYYRRIRANSIMTTKLSMRNFTGLMCSFDKMWSDYKNGAHSFSNDLCKKCLGNIFSCLVFTYESMSFGDRMKARKILSEIFGRFEQENYFDNNEIKKLVIKHRIFFFRRIYRAIVKIAKKVFPPSVINNLKGNIRIMLLNRSDNAPCIMTPDTERRNIYLMCTPQHGNLGDHAIAIACKKYLEEIFPEARIIEVPMRVLMSSSSIKKFLSNVSDKDIITICGGGWLGSLWLHDEQAFRRVVKKFPNNKIIVFPQTVYFENTESGRKEFNISKKIYNNHKQLYIYTRERNSYELLVKEFGMSPERVFLSPDMVLTLNAEGGEKRDGVLFCIRTDQEGVIGNLTYRKLYMNVAEQLNRLPKFISTVLDHGVDIEEREEAVDGMLAQISGAQLVITDRLHCMLFCAITGTPCIAFDNLSNKVSGVYEWIKNLDYIKLINSYEEAMECVPKMLVFKPNKAIPYKNKDILNIKEFCDLS